MPRRKLAYYITLPDEGSEAEKEINVKMDEYLMFICTGCTCKEAAERMGFSEKVEWEINKRLKEKFDAQTMPQVTFNFGRSLDSRRVPDKNEEDKKKMG